MTLPGGENLGSSLKPKDGSGMSEKRKKKKRKKKDRGEREKKEKEKRKKEKGREEVRGVNLSSVRSV